MHGAGGDRRQRRAPNLSCPLLPATCCRAAPRPGRLQHLCGHAPSCGLSRPKCIGWGPRAICQPGSTASSVASEQGIPGVVLHTHGMLPQVGEALGSIPAGTQNRCCRMNRWAASWCASVRARWASCCPTGEGAQPRAMGTLDPTLCHHQPLCPPPQGQRALPTLCAGPAAQWALRDPG